jgi:hypothetical protein
MRQTWFRDLNEFDTVLATRVSPTAIVPAWGSAWADLSATTRTLVLVNAADMLFADPNYQFPEVELDLETLEWAPGRAPDEAMQLALALWAYRTWAEPDLFLRIEEIARGLRSRNLPHVSETYAPLSPQEVSVGLYGAQVAALLERYRIPNPEAVGGCV